MKGSPTEVISMMHSMLTRDLINIIEKKRDDLVKQETIIDAIGSTFLDWITHVIEVYKETSEYCFIQDDIWHTHIPQDYDKLAEDICYIMNDLKTVYVGQGEDVNNILFKHDSGFYVLIYITETYFGEFGAMDVYIRAGINIDNLYYGLY